jgi:ribonucleoside-diphosphate reductase alpha chain
MLATVPATSTELPSSDSGNREESPLKPILNSPFSPPTGTRNRLPDERPSLTHKFRVGSHEGYLVVGLYPNGQPGEIFVTMAKEGSTVSGLINSFAQAVSIGLQYGVPLSVFCSKFQFIRFEPSGWTGNPALPQASSVVDYIFRWIQLKFLGEEASAHGAPAPVGPLYVEPCSHEAAGSGGHDSQPTEATDAPSCTLCGSLMRRNGACHACAICGWTSGCG